MNKRTKKKQKKRNRDGGRNKENVLETEQQSDREDKQEDDVKPKIDLCYEIKHSDVMGRYIVASRPIKAGEVIMQHEALAVGPCSGCGVSCLACYRELDLSAIVKCPGCRWPLCSVSCPGRGTYTGHSSYECDTLAGVPPDYVDLEDLKDCYNALMPLRCLLLKKFDAQKWSIVKTMESHNELRRSREDIYPHNEKTVVLRLKAWGLDYDPEEVHTVCGILEVNAFEVGGGGAGAAARALYPAAFLLAHACTPTTAHTDHDAAPGRPLTLRAALDHREGDVITLCYAYTLQGTLKRREHIRLSKFFSCACPRCSDRAELGTYCSAFRCPRCGGRVLSKAPLEEDASWSCIDNDCTYTMPAAAVHLLLKRLSDELEQIDANDVSGFESFIHKYRNVLHSSHYLQLSAKHSLSQLYGKVSDYMIHEMSDQLLNRKIDICRELMKVFDVLEPGYSRLRGITLYELHAPLMVLTTRDFEKKVISKENLRKRLKEIVGYLKESALILGFEPAHSAEGLMAAAARDALRTITTWERIIGKIS